MIIALIVIGLGALDAAAIAWGADSRDQLPGRPPSLTRPARYGGHPMHPLTSVRPRGLAVTASARSRRAIARRTASTAERPGHGRRLAVARHPVALVLAALSRGSAAAVRRLDECVADDLGRALSPPINRPPVALPRRPPSSAAGRASRTGGVPLP